MDQDLLERGGLQVARDGAVLTVTMNRPEVRFAMTQDSFGDLLAGK